MAFSVRRLTQDRFTRGRAARDHWGVDRSLRGRGSRDAGSRPAVPAAFDVVTTTAVTPEGVLATVSPVGEVDLDSAYRIREAVDAALVGRTPARIVIDLGRVTLIDSVGIGVLVACYHAAAAFGVPLTATNPSVTVYRQLWVSGLVGLFRLATPHATGTHATGTHATGTHATGTHATGRDHAAA